MLLQLLIPLLTELAMGVVERTVESSKAKKLINMALDVVDRGSAVEGRLALILDEVRANKKAAEEAGATWTPTHEAIQALWLEIETRDEQWAEMAAAVNNEPVPDWPEPTLSPDAGVDAMENEGGPPRAA